MSEIIEEELNARTEIERIKASSNYLRGTIKASLNNPLTGSLAEDDTQLSKYHGIYQQDDRDLRDERRLQKLEPHFQFLVRLRVPGGVTTPSQWLAIDKIANKYCNKTLRLTSRQTFQFHGLLKRNLKTTIAAINQSLLDTIAACGDVNRNVMCTSYPHQLELHREVYYYSCQVHKHLTPQTRAYHEIWLNDDLVESSQADQEPIYGQHYLPRKFKIAFAIPPSNDVDIFANDLGFIAITEQDRLVGFNITVGGGLSMTHGDHATYPRLADVIGFCSKEKLVEVAEQIVKIQRDFGDRTNRKHARFKYTLEDRGVQWLLVELNGRLGWSVETPRPFDFTHTGDRYGWIKGIDNTWAYAQFIENGRISDSDHYSLMTALRTIAQQYRVEFRVTANQNLIITNINESEKPDIDHLLHRFGLIKNNQQSALRLNAMACVSFPTCGLAMAESERYLPTLVDKLDAIIKKAGLENDPILIRMTGCPNGCARSVLGEIGLIGKAPGKYNLYLGASFTGQRLNKLYRENINEKQILEALTPIIHRYAIERESDERFGDFVIRAGYVTAVQSGRDFHK